jgi:hypothetical protein
MSHGGIIGLSELLLFVLGHAGKYFLFVRSIQILGLEHARIVMLIEVC